MGLYASAIAGIYASTLYHVSILAWLIISIALIGSIAFTYRLITRYNVYFVAIIGYIIFVYMGLVQTFPRVMAGFIYLSMLLIYIFSSSLCCNKIQTKALSVR